MGYTKGKGLGKKEQGRVAIIEASMQKGRRGLGHSVSGFEQKSVDWDFEQEEVSSISKEMIMGDTPCGMHAYDEHHVIRIYPDLGLYRYGVIYWLMIT